MRVTSLALYEIARDMVARRKLKPEDPSWDPTSAMLKGVTADGTPFPEEFVVGMVRQVLVVGIVAPTVFMLSLIHI